MITDDPGMETVQDRLVDLHDLAELLDLPLRWLKTEAEQGRIPCLKVNREYRFNAIAVQQTLFQRAGEQRITTSDSDTAPVGTGRGD